MQSATCFTVTSMVDTVVVASDVDFIKTKKEYFQREISIINTIELLPKLKVSPCDVCTACRLVETHSFHI